MRKLLFLLIFIILVFPINSKEQEVILNPLKDALSVASRVYVRPTNFKVLDENIYNTITVIKEAKIPGSYEGTLIQLQSEDLTDILRVIKNLNTKKVVLFNEDSKIADKLRELPIEIAII